MLLLLIGIVVLMVPIRIDIGGSLHNTKLECRVKLILLRGLPISIYLFNLIDKPLEFKVRIFGVEKDVKRLIHSYELKSRDNRESTKKKRTMTIKELLRLRRYIHRFNAFGKFGLADRADTTAIIVGAINGFFLPLFKACSINNTQIYFEPQYDFNILSVDFKCIISVNAVNIIHEAIRYFFKRRK